jgi:Uma2 family endonuclease
MSMPSRSFVTPEEYLEAERKSVERHEYVNGRVYPRHRGAEALAGATREHNRITGNIFAELRAQLRGRPCEAYVTDMRVKVAPTGMYTYPDVVVVCDPPQLEDRNQDTLLNPVVIVEVLSPSTEAYDRGDKFAHYRRLPSLAEYVLVAQDRPHVERFVKRGEAWVLQDVEGLESAVAFDAIGCALPLRDIYERVEFSAAESHGPAPA